MAITSDEDPAYFSALIFESFVFLLSVLSVTGIYYLKQNYEHIATGDYSRVERNVRFTVRIPPKEFRR